MDENGFTGLEQLQKLSDMSVTYKSMKTFLMDLTLGGEGDCIRIPGKRYSSDSVRLITLHGSKGLEFPTVFLCGVNKNYIPIEAASGEEELEEERRLFYVGMTRARDELILSAYGEPSPFLKEISERKMIISTGAEKKEDTGIKQLSHFDFIK